MDEESRLISWFLDCTAGRMAVPLAEVENTGRGRQIGRLELGENLSLV